MTMPLAADIKQATKLAEQYLHDLYEGRDFENLRLEEVEWREHENAWLITLGFDEPDRNRLSAAIGQPPRDFKTFEIEAETGRLRAMKMRRPDYA